MLSEIGIEYTVDEYHDRIRESDFSAVELFLKAGMAPNAEDRAGYLVIDEGNIPMLELLFKYGLEANETGLVLNAIWEKNIQILELLKDKGADFNRIHDLKNSIGETQSSLPLAYTLDKNRWIDKYGPSGSQYDSYDRKYYEIAEWLLDNGARLRGWQRGDTPLSDIYVTEDLEAEAPSLYKKLSE